METSPGTTPAQRVRAFVEARSQMTGPVDREIVMDLWVKDVQHVLTYADLIALCDDAEAWERVTSFRIEDVIS